MSKALDQGSGYSFENNEKKVYIYAEVDIDKIYLEIVGKSKKVKTFMEQEGLQPEFFQKMRNYKNLVFILLFREFVLTIKFNSLFIKSN